MLRNMTEAPPRETRAQERRDQLIETALALFAQEGVDGTRIADLAQAAGVAHGLVYHYFRSKEELLFAALDRASFKDQLLGILQGSEGRPASDVLLDYVTRFDALLAERQELLRVLVREALVRPQVAARWTTMVDGATDQLAHYLDSCVAAGGLRAHDSKHAACLLIHPIYMQHLTGIPAHFDFQVLIATVLHGIASREVAAPDAAAP
jgi:AcrR family transcriptional regulator